MGYSPASCACGQPATKTISGGPDPAHRVCEGCSFRHTVMRAAGREQEFWDARKDFVLPGWVSYKIEYTTSTPDTTIRLRMFKAGETAT